MTTPAADAFAGLGGARRAPRRAVLVVLSVASTLVALEAFLRLGAPRPAGTLADAIAGAEPLEPGGVGRWVHVLRVDPNERIVYRLRPRFDGHIDMGGRATPIATNSFGYRGPEWALEKPQGTVRIVGLGDSVMMGFGVAVEESYLSLLQAHLEAAHTETRFECINLAVGGYNTVQEIETLREVGLAFDPDLVLVGVLENDANGIIYQHVTTSAARMDRSFLLSALAGRSGERLWEDHGGFDPLRAAVDELVALSELHQFETFAFTYVTQRRALEILSVFRRAGIPVRNLGEGLRAYIQEHRIPDYGGSNLVLGPEDGHPSALGHALIARHLAEALEQSGWIARAVETVRQE